MSIRSDGDQPMDKLEWARQNPELMGHVIPERTRTPASNLSSRRITHEKVPTDPVKSELSGNEPLIQGQQPPLPLLPQPPLPPLPSKRSEPEKKKEAEVKQDASGQVIPGSYGSISTQGTTQPSAADLQRERELKSTPPPGITEKVSTPATNRRSALKPGIVKANQAAAQLMKDLGVEKGKVTRTWGEWIRGHSIQKVILDRLAKKTGVDLKTLSEGQRKSLEQRALDIYQIAVDINKNRNLMTRLDYIYARPSQDHGIGWLERAIRWVRETGPSMFHTIRKHLIKVGSQKTVAEDLKNIKDRLKTLEESLRPKHSMNVNPQVDKQEADVNAIIQSLRQTSIGSLTLLRKDLERSVQDQADLVTAQDQMIAAHKSLHLAIEWAKTPIDSIRHTQDAYQALKQLEFLVQRENERLAEESKRKDQAVPKNEIHSAIELQYTELKEMFKEACEVYNLTALTSAERNLLVTMRKPGSGKALRKFWNDTNPSNENKLKTLRLLGNLLSRLKLQLTTDDHWAKKDGKQTLSDIGMLEQQINDLLKPHSDQEIGVRQAQGKPLTVESNWISRWQNNFQSLNVYEAFNEKFALAAKAAYLISEQEKALAQANETPTLTPFEIKVELVKRDRELTELSNAVEARKHDVHTAAEDLRLKRKETLQKIDKLNRDLGTLETSSEEYAANRDAYNKQKIDLQKINLSLFHAKELHQVFEVVSVRIDEAQKQQQEPLNSIVPRKDREGVLPLAETQKALNRTKVLEDTNRLFDLIQKQGINSEKVDELIQQNNALNKQAPQDDDIILARIRIERLLDDHFSEKIGSFQAQQKGQAITFKHLHEFFIAKNQLKNLNSELLNEFVLPAVEAIYLQQAKAAKEDIVKQLDVRKDRFDGMTEDDLILVLNEKNINELYLLRAELYYIGSADVHIGNLFNAINKRIDTIKQQELAKAAEALSGSPEAVAQRARNIIRDSDYLLDNITGKEGLLTKSILPSPFPATDRQAEALRANQKELRVIKQYFLKPAHAHKAGKALRDQINQRINRIEHVLSASAMPGRLQAMKLGNQINKEIEAAINTSAHAASLETDTRKSCEHIFKARELLRTLKQWMDGLSASESELVDREKIRAEIYEPLLSDLENLAEEYGLFQSDWGIPDLLSENLRVVQKIGEKAVEASHLRDIVRLLSTVATTPLGIPLDDTTRTNVQALAHGQRGKKDQSTEVYEAPLFREISSAKTRADLRGKLADMSAKEFSMAARQVATLLDRLEVNLLANDEILTNPTKRDKLLFQIWHIQQQLKTYAPALHQELVMLRQGTPLATAFKERFSFDAESAYLLRSSIQAKKAYKEAVANDDQRRAIEAAATLVSNQRDIEILALTAAAEGRKLAPAFEMMFKSEPDFAEAIELKPSEQRTLDDMVDGLFVTTDEDQIKKYQDILHKLGARAFTRALPTEKQREAKLQLLHLLFFVLPSNEKAFQLVSKDPVVKRLMDKFGDVSISTVLDLMSQLDQANKPLHLHQTALNLYRKLLLAFNKSGLDDPRVFDQAVKLHDILHKDAHRDALAAIRGQKSGLHHGQRATHPEIDEALEYLKNAKTRAGFEQEFNEIVALSNLPPSEERNKRVDAVLTALKDPQKLQALQEFPKAQRLMDALLGCEGVIRHRDETLRALTAKGYVPLDREHYPTKLLAASYKKLIADFATKSYPLQVLADAHESIFGKLPKLEDPNKWLDLIKEFRPDVYQQIMSEFEKDMSGNISEQLELGKLHLKRPDWQLYIREPIEALRALLKNPIAQRIPSLAEKIEAAIPELEAPPAQVKRFIDKLEKLLIQFWKGKVSAQVFKDMSKLIIETDPTVVDVAMDRGVSKAHGNQAINTALQEIVVLGKNSNALDIVESAIQLDIDWQYSKAADQAVGEKEEQAEARAARELRMFASILLQEEYGPSHPIPTTLDSNARTRILESIIVRHNSKPIWPKAAFDEFVSSVRANIQKNLPEAEMKQKVSDVQPKPLAPPEEPISLQAGQKLLSELQNPMTPPTSEKMLKLYMYFNQIENEEFRGQAEAFFKQWIASAPNNQSQEVEQGIQLYLLNTVLKRGDPSEIVRFVSNFSQENPHLWTEVRQEVMGEYNKAAMALKHDSLGIPDNFQEILKSAEQQIKKGEKSESFARILKLRTELQSKRELLDKDPDARELYNQYMTVLDDHAERLGLYTLTKSQTKLLKDVKQGRADTIVSSWNQLEGLLQRLDAQAAGLVTPLPQERQRAVNDIRAVEEQLDELRNSQFQFGVGNKIHGILNRRNKTDIEATEKEINAALSTGGEIYQELNRHLTDAINAKRKNPGKTTELSQQAVSGLAVALQKAIELPDSPAREAIVTLMDRAGPYLWRLDKDQYNFFFNRQPPLARNMAPKRLVDGLHKVGLHYLYTQLKGLKGDTLTEILHRRDLNRALTVRNSEVSKDLRAALNIKHAMEERFSSSRLRPSVQRPPQSPAEESAIEIEFDVFPPESSPKSAEAQQAETKAAAATESEDEAAARRLQAQQEAAEAERRMAQERASRKEGDTKRKKEAQP